MKNAILFGNGLNLLNGGISWNDLLEKISSEPLIKKIPNTLQYETIVLASEKYYNESFIFNAGSLLLTNGSPLYTKKPIEEDIKNKIKDELKNFTSNFAYQRLSELNVEQYITTNYDQTLYNLLCKKGYKKGESNNTESIYSIRRRFGLINKSGTCKYIWPIHGTIQHPKSIMLGLDHYCGSIGKINDYLKGDYNYTKNGKTFTLDKITSRLKEQKCEIPFSWIDLFFTHNIHIIGLGLQYDEIDLWWILNRRQRYIKQFGKENTISNKIHFYGNTSNSMKKLLNKFGVEVYTFRQKGLKPNDPLYYEVQYNYYIDKITSFCK
ncbi:MAG: hypothetical protein IJB01_07940 [Bacteroidaceae bacterium]|nr:hypothetical protein [Bacteroidaceae bacterium]